MISRGSHVRKCGLAFPPVFLYGSRRLHDPDSKVDPADKFIAL
jgi:hypothetical protein